MIKITEETFKDLREDYSGICTACMAVRSGDTEPDARNYPCDACGKDSAYGVEELLMMDMIELVEDGQENIVW